MVKLYTVNEAMQAGEALNNQRIYIEGLFSFDTEYIAIEHWPKAEQDLFDNSTIWIEESRGVFGCNVQSLEKLSGKRWFV